LTTIDLLDSVDVNPNGGAFEARFWGAKLPIAGNVREVSQPSPGKATRRRHFPSGQAIIRLINKEWAVYTLPRINRVHRAVANAERVSISAVSNV
jgi:hypothetical protein